MVQSSAALVLAVIASLASSVRAFEAYWDAIEQVALLQALADRGRVFRASLLDRAGLDSTTTGKAPSASELPLSSEHEVDIPFCSELVARRLKSQSKAGRKGQAGVHAKSAQWKAQQRSTAEKKFRARVLMKPAMQRGAQKQAEKDYVRSVMKDMEKDDGRRTPARDAKAKDRKESKKQKEKEKTGEKKEKTDRRKEPRKMDARRKDTWKKLYRNDTEKTGHLVSPMCMGRRGMLKKKKAAAQSKDPANQDGAKKPGKRKKPGEPGPLGRSITIHYPKGLATFTST